MNTQAILLQLKAERDRLNEAINALDPENSANGHEQDAVARGDRARRRRARRHRCGVAAEQERDHEGSGEGEGRPRLSGPEPARSGGNDSRRPRATS